MGSETIVVIIRVAIKSIDLTVESRLSGVIRRLMK
jgi:hypothetical protein